MKKHIHNIHDYIRNNIGIYGQNALTLFNFFYGL